MPRDLYGRSFRQGQPLQQPHTEDVLVDVESGSWAALYEEDGHWIVRQDGPDALWKAVEEQLGRWQAVGTPAAEELTVSVTPQGQTIRW
ncbi:hypothetical protein OHB25_58230 [Streptomyces mirabilis]|uniref:hypothetical protein n=1 Tax=Streptomyces mirabilis TaxID=68239 RepID=UPI002E1D611E